MMAASPLFSATITTGHPRQTYIRALSEYFLYSDTTNETCIPIIVINNQHHVLSTAAQPEPHHAPHMFHVPGQSHHARTSSRGHESWSPQGLVTIYVGILQHPPEYESPYYMFILLPYALQVNSLYVYVLSLYNTPVCCMYFASLNINLATVMVHARSRSFQRTIKGWLRRSL